MTTIFLTSTLASRSVKHHYSTQLTFLFRSFLSKYIKENGDKAWEQFMEQMWSARNILMDYENLFWYLATYMKDEMRVRQVNKTFDRTLQGNVPGNV